MKRVLLVEPHPDDVCLGLLYFVEKEKVDYHLVSVSSHNERNSKLFCEKMGISWYSTKLVDDIPYQECRISPREIKKQKNSFLYQRMYYLEQYEERYLEIEELITKAIEEIPCETIITTLGILHPIHVLVSITCEMIAKRQNKELIYFADFPYASRKFGEKIIKDSGMKYSLVHNESPEIRKDKLLEEYYPTETNVLRWDRKAITDSPEKIFLIERKAGPVETKSNSVKKKIKISIFSCGGAYMTGAHRHAIYLKKALEMVGVATELVDFDNIGDPDILLFESLGIAFENEMRANKDEKQLKNVIKYMGKIPFVLVRHSISDRSVFKNSFRFFENFVWDLVVPVNDAEDMLSLIEEENKFKRMVHIDHPFEFENKWFADRSKCRNVILSPSRIASCKRTNLVLDIAKMFRGKKRFLIAGREDGVYWYRVIKEHPNRAHAIFVGEYEDPVSMYQRSAFAMDLAYLYRYGRVQKSKQYTLLESIGCGNIPIIFDNYRYEGGFEAIWLPLPERNGNRIIFDVKKYFEIIKDSKYDFEIARENRKLLKKEHDLKKIGNQYKEEFERLL